MDNTTPTSDQTRQFAFLVNEARALVVALAQATDQLEALTKFGAAIEKHAEGAAPYDEMFPFG